MSAAPLQSQGTLCPTTRFPRDGDLPTTLRHAGDISFERQLSKTQPTQRELADEATWPPA